MSRIRMSRHSQPQLGTNHTIEPRVLRQGRLERCQTAAGSWLHSLLAVRADRSVQRLLRSSRGILETKKRRRPHFCTVVGGKPVADLARLPDEERCGFLAWFDSLL